MVAHFGELNADKGAHEELDHNLTGLVPVTPKAAWEGLNIYEILIGRLMRLERALVANGFEDPVPRIQFHLGVLRASTGAPPNRQRRNAVVPGGSDRACRYLTAASPR